jgi:hypothetical protein
LVPADQQLGNARQLLPPAWLSEKIVALVSESDRRFTRLYRPVARSETQARVDDENKERNRGAARAESEEVRARCAMAGPQTRQVDMTERMNERFLSKTRVRTSAGGTRRLVLFMFWAACSMATLANAGTITITSTLAVAGPNEDPFFATYENSNALATSKAVADVTSGHLGALVSALPGGTAGADALVILGLSFQDMTADDFLTMNMSLHGTFTPGSGAEADFFVDDGTSVTNAATITCNSFNVQFHGVPCFPATSVQALVPLDNVDSLFLTWQLQPGIGGASGTADFFNSDDFSITVPNGTIIVNNPGGSLFQTPETSSVPEPNLGFLLGPGLVFAMLFGKRRVAPGNRLM